MSNENNDPIVIKGATFNFPVNIGANKEQLPEWVEEIIKRYCYDGSDGESPMHSFDKAMVFHTAKDVYSRMQEENNKLREALELLDTAIDYAAENNVIYAITTNDKNIIKEALINKP